MFSTIPAIPSFTPFSPLLPSALLHALPTFLLLFYLTAVDDEDGLDLVVREGVKWKKNEEEECWTFVPSGEL